MKHTHRLLQAVVFLVVLLTLTCFSGARITLADDPLTVYFLDVGQADASVIECGGEYMIIDGGNAADSSLVYSFLANTLGIDHLDYMIATHPHEDHIGGLSGALNACSVGTLYSSVADYDSKTFDSLKKYADKQNLAITVPTKKVSFSLGDARVQIIPSDPSFPDINDQSLVTKITYGKTTLLFMGDAEWDEEHYLVDSGLDLSATILKVGHHGSSSSSSYVFLREVMPTYAIISVGTGNSYGHPTEEALSRLRDAGAQIYRTDKNGQITVTCYSNGKVSIETDKGGPDAKQSTSTTTSVLKQTTTQPASQTVKYIGNKNTKKLHYPECSSVKSMKESNKVEFYSRDDAIKQGYVPCKKCNP